MKKEDQKRFICFLGIALIIIISKFGTSTLYYKWDSYQRESRQNYQKVGNYWKELYQEKQEKETTQEKEEVELDLEEIVQKEVTEKNDVEQLSQQKMTTQTASLSENNLSLKRTAEEEMQQTEKQEEEYYNIVQTIGNVEQKYVIRTEKQLLNVPPDIVNLFIQNGFTISVTDEDIAKKYYSDVEEGKEKITKVRATFSFNGKYLILENREDDSVMEGVVEHEFGHYLDKLKGEPSQTDEFKEIYLEEKETFKSRISKINAGSVTNEKEFFAEIFSYMLLDSSKCTPKAQAYVQRFIEE